MKRAVFITLILSLICMNSLFTGNVSAFTDTEIDVEELNFRSLSDPDLLRYIEDYVYYDLVRQLNSSDYFVEKVEVVYKSKSYLEELAYNSKSTVYFGYTLNELQERFQGKSYVFTLGDDGTTIVKEFEGYDDTYEQSLKNIAIGSGVIFLCVTVSLVSGGVGAPAVSAILMASAKTGTVMALSTGALSGAAAGIIKGYETHDFSQTCKAAALEGSDAFKWGAITGMIAGGASELQTLRSMTPNGLTLNQAAIIQKESGYPLDVIHWFNNTQEYEFFHNELGLQSAMVGDRSALIRDVNCCAIFDGVSNLTRMANGKSPLDSSGTGYQLHHVGQNENSTLAILTGSEHYEIFSILHNTGNVLGAVARKEFNEIIRPEFWKTFAKMYCTACSY